MCRPNRQEHEIDPELMGALARVFANMRGEIIQDEQNPLAGILLTDLFEDLAELLFPVPFRLFKSPENRGHSRWQPTAVPTGGR